MILAEEIASIKIKKNEFVNIKTDLKFIQVCFVKYIELYYFLAASRFISEIANLVKRVSQFFSSSNVC